jgi:ABC-type transporter MlaC component
MTFIKKNFWKIVGAVIVIAALIFIRDQNTLNQLKTFFRRKQVEDTVNKIKEDLNKNKAGIEVNEEKIIKLAEQLEKDKVDVKKASDEDIKKFYDDFFSR